MHDARDAVHTFDRRINVPLLPAAAAAFGRSQTRACYERIYRGCGSSGCKYMCVGEMPCCTGSMFMVTAEDLCEVCKEEDIKVSGMKRRSFFLSLCVCVCVCPKER